MTPTLPEFGRIAPNTPNIIETITHWDTYTDVLCVPLIKSARRDFHIFRTGQVFMYADPVYLPQAGQRKRSNEALVAELARALRLLDRRVLPWVGGAPSQHSPDPAVTSYATAMDQDTHGNATLVQDYYGKWTASWWHQDGGFAKVEKHESAYYAMQHLERLMGRPEFNRYFLVSQ